MAWYDFPAMFIRGIWLCLSPYTDTTIRSFFYFFIGSDLTILIHSSFCKAFKSKSPISTKLFPWYFDLGFYLSLWTQRSMGIFVLCSLYFSYLIYDLLYLFIYAWICFENYSTWVMFWCRYVLQDYILLNTCKKLWTRKIKDFLLIKQHSISISLFCVSVSVHIHTNHISEC